MYKHKDAKELRKFFLRLVITDLLDLFGDEIVLWTKKEIRVRGDTNCWTAVYMIFGSAHAEKEYFKNKEGERFKTE